MANAPEYNNLVHIPMPSTTNVPTPTPFGDPFTAGGYINDRPPLDSGSTWYVRLTVGQKWKSFQPKVNFLDQEFSRLLWYEQCILTRFTPETTASDITSVLEPLSYGRFLDNPINLTQDDEYSDWDEPLYRSLADAYRIFPRGREMSRWSCRFGLSKYVKGN